MTRLEELPARLDDLTLQVSQLRTEMRSEFSDIRTEMRGEFSAIRTEMHGEFSAIRSELRGELADQVGGLATQMRVLHEDVVGRIALLHEGLSAGPKRRPKRK